MDQLFQDPAQSVQLLVSGFGDGQALPPPDGLVVMVKLRLLDPEEQAPQLPHDPAQSTEGVGDGDGVQLLVSGDVGHAVPPFEGDVVTT